MTRFGSQGSDAAGGVGWTDRGQRQAAGSSPESSHNSPGRQSEAPDRGRAGGQRGGWVEKAQGPWSLEPQTPFLAGSALSSFQAPTSPWCPQQVGSADVSLLTSRVSPWSASPPSPQTEGLGGTHWTEEGSGEQRLRGSPRSPTSRGEWVWSRSPHSQGSPTSRRPFLPWVLPADGAHLPEGPSTGFWVRQSRSSVYRARLCDLGQVP